MSQRWQYVELSILARISYHRVHRDINTSSGISFFHLLWVDYYQYIYCENLLYYLLWSCRGGALPMYPLLLSIALGRLLHVVSGGDGDALGVGSNRWHEEDATGCVFLPFTVMSPMRASRLDLHKGGVSLSGGIKIVRTESVCLFLFLFPALSLPFFTTPPLLGPFGPWPFALVFASFLIWVCSLADNAGQDSCNPASDRLWSPVQFCAPAGFACTSRISQRHRKCTVGRHQQQPYCILRTENVVSILSPSQQKLNNNLPCLARWLLCKCGWCSWLYI